MRRLVIGKRGPKCRNLNRRRAIRHHCLACSNFAWQDVIECARGGCQLHPFRLGGIKGGGHDPDSRREAIRRFCRQCAGGDTVQAGCEARDCALFNYRE